jgi:hypothetical protein
LIELMQTRFRASDFDWAQALAEVLLLQFEDTAQGGFFSRATTTNASSTG